MSIPLRLAVMGITPRELATIRGAVSGTGRRVEVRWLGGPGELAQGFQEDTDGVIISGEVLVGAPERWFPLGPWALGVPIVILLDPGDTSRIGILRELGVGSIVPRGSRSDLRLAIRALADRSRKPVEGPGLVRGRTEVGADRRFMAGLLGAIGQNLRDSLGAITGAIEVLAFQGEEGVVGRFRTIEYLERQCAKMNRLLEDYAEIVRIAEGPTELRGELVELGAVLDRAVHQTWTEDYEGGLRFERRARADSVWMIGDSRRLEQLARNGMRHVHRANPGSDSIQIDWREVGDRIRLVIEAKPEANEPVSSELDLDLFLVTCLADRLGGRVRPGRPFEIELPGLVESRSDGSARPGRSNGEGRGEGHHALLVDDNLNSGKALGHLIGRLGWHVRITPSISEALGMIRSLRPEVALIDLHLPLMDGQTLARRIRRDSLGTPPLLIGISSSDELSTAECAGGSAFDHVLLKPVRRDQIASLLPSIGTGPIFPG